MFTNANNADCGEVTTCVPLPTGCTGTYAGKASIDASTLQLSITQDEDAGYTETLCIKCDNALGSSVQHDNWDIEQTRNCASALVGAT